MLAEDHVKSKNKRVGFQFYIRMIAERSSGTAILIRFLSWCLFWF
jgi:hypothetical protein